jgi:hypothetical protein
MRPARMTLRIVSRIERVMIGQVRRGATVTGAF